MRKSKSDVADSLRPLGKTKEGWMDGKNEKRRGRSSSYAAEERLDYCCKEGVSQHKQPLGSQHCLTPFRAPTPQPPRRAHTHTSQPTAVSARKITCVPIYRSLPALHTIWPLEIKCICFPFKEERLSSLKKQGRQTPKIWAIIQTQVPKKKKITKHSEDSFNAV